MIQLPSPKCEANTLRTAVIPQTKAYWTYWWNSNKNKCVLPKWTDRARCPVIQRERLILKSLNIGEIFYIHWRIKTKPFIPKAGVPRITCESTSHIQTFLEMVWSLRTGRWPQTGQASPMTCLVRRPITVWSGKLQKFRTPTHTHTALENDEWAFGHT